MKLPREAQQGIEPKPAAVEGRYDWFTALAYAKLHGHPTNRPHLIKAGTRAGALMRARGEQPVPCQDAGFGSVDTYPADVLDRAFREIN